jgi:polysaccharide pyruvyl transferase WcaK-like protein
MTILNSILILGGDADGNLGDRAIQQAMCRSIGALHPTCRMTVVSREPERTRRSFGACTIPPGPRGFIALCRAIRRSRLVLVGGGGLFQDDDSLVKMPYWAARVALVRFLGRPVVGYSLGVGPLSSVPGRWAARLAFAMMTQVTVRDRAAEAVARPLSRRAVSILPDPAIALAPAPRRAARACLAAAGVPTDGRPLVGVAVRRWFPPRPRIIPHKIAHRLGLPDPQAGPEGERLLALLAETLDRVVAGEGGHAVFMPSYAVAHEGDDALCRSVLARMRAARGTVLMLDDPALYKACCAELSAFLGGRMHPMILSAGVGTPVVGLAYNPKFRGFLGLIGAEHACLDVAAFVDGGDPAPLAVLLAEALRAGRRPTQAAERLAAEIRGFDAALAVRLA